VKGGTTSGKAREAACGVLDLEVEGGWWHTWAGKRGLKKISIIWLGIEEGGGECNSLAHEHCQRDYRGLI